MIMKIITTMMNNVERGIIVITMTNKMIKGISVMYEYKEEIGRTRVVRNITDSGYS